MGWKLTGGLIRCGRCGKRYTISHTCVYRLDRKPGKTRLAPKASAFMVCGRCHKRYTNPLTHVCKQCTDFTKRQAQAVREAKEAARRAQQGSRRKHDYRDCSDDHCQYFPCRVYREGEVYGLVLGYAKGYADGMADGFVAGYGAGRSDGYDAGFADGQAAAAARR